MKYSIESTFEELIELGFDITLEASKHTQDDDLHAAIWYCSLYYGDSNSPWKPGTLLGPAGFGMTQIEALRKALINLKEVK